MSVAATVEYEDTALVEPDCEVGDESASPYRVLHDRQRRTVLQELREEYSDAAVDAVLGGFWDWKRTSYANHARTHERLFGSVLGVDAPERDGDLLARGPRGEEAAVAAELHEVSQRFLAHHADEVLAVYRGLDVSVGQLVPALLDDPGRGRFDVDPCPVFVNVTTDEVVAREYGFVVARMAIRREAVGLAPDYVLPLVRDGDVRKRDAELRLRGDRLPAVPTGDVVLPSSGRPLVSAFRTPGTLDETEHEDVLDVVMRVDRRDGRVGTDAGYRALHRWHRAFRRAVGPGRWRAVLGAARAIERIGGNS